MLNINRDWLPILVKQEQLLVFEKFNKDDAWNLGCKTIELIKTKYSNCKRGIAIQIFFEHTLVFSHLMETSNIENNWWMQKKLNTVYKTGMSSLRSLIEIEYGERKREAWCDDEGQYALCGGCIPIRLKDYSITGYLLISNLEHEYDHQLAADALALIAGVDIPSII